MPKKSRAAREQPSLDPSPSINAPVAGSMAWAAQLHAVIQQYAWASAVQTPAGHQEITLVYICRLILNDI